MSVFFTGNSQLHGLILVAKIQKNIYYPLVFPKKLHTFAVIFYN